MPLTIRNMEIFQTGVPQRTPLMTFNSEPEHLISMVANFTAGEPRDGVPLKFGHTSPTFNRKIAEALGMPEDLIFGEDGAGRPRLGSGFNIRVENNKLVSDFSSVPDGMGDFIGPGRAYSRVSSEIAWIIDVENSVVVDAVLMGVAVLGDEAPNAPNLDQSRIIIENDVNGKPQGTFRSVHVYEITNALFETSDEPSASAADSRSPLDMLRDVWHTIANVKKEPAQAEPKLENEMDIDKIREALGLPAEASEEEVLKAMADYKAAFDNAASESVAPAAEPEGESKPEPKVEKSIMDEDHKVPVTALNTAVADAVAAALAPVVERLTQVESRNAATQSELLDAEYVAACTAFNALPGTPEDLGKGLAQIERTAGREAAQELLKSYEAANTNLVNAGLLSNRGVKTPSQDLAGVDHPYMEKVREYATANSLDEHTALARYSVNHPKEWAAFQAATRNAS